MSTVVSKIDRNWSNKIVSDMDTGLLEMMTDIHRRSVILAPKDTRALVNSSLIAKNGLMHYVLSYGSSRVPYARRRHFENKKNPQTIGYLEKAADGVLRGNTAKYFKGNILK